MTVTIQKRKRAVNNNCTPVAAPLKFTNGVYRDTSNWQFDKLELAKHKSMVLGSDASNCAWRDVFTDGLGPVNGNSQEKLF